MLVGLNLRDNGMETARITDGSILTMGHGTAVAQGRVPFHTPASAFGSATLGSGQTHDIWQGVAAIKPGPVALGFRLSVVSTSAEDAGTGGLGVRTLRVVYLDTAGVEKTEDLVLTGLTPVLSVATDIMFIQCAFALTLGVYGGNAVGTITLSSVSGGTAMNVLAAGRNRCGSAHRMAPAGKVLIISDWVASAAATTAAKRAVIALSMTSPDGVTVLPGVFIQRGTAVCIDNTVSASLNIPLVVPPLAEVKLTAITDGAASVYGSFFGWTEPA